MPGRQEQLNSGKNLLVPIDEDKPIRSLQITKLFVGYRVSTGGIGRPSGDQIIDPEVVFFSLNIDFRIGEQLDSSAMVEVEMGDDEVFYLFRVNPDAGKGFIRGEVPCKSSLGSQSRPHARIENDRLASPLDRPDVIVPLDRFVPLLV